MAALRENAVAKFIGLLYAAPYTTGTPSFRRLGSVRALANRVTYEKTEIKADDTGIVLTFTKPECVIECTFLESEDTALMDTICPGTKSDVSASPVNVVTEVLLDFSAGATEWGTNEILIFENKNGDNTIVTSVTIDHNTVALVDGTDYELVLLDDGRTGAVRIGAALTLTGNIDVDYTYTPNASTSFSFTREQLELPRLIVKIEATNSAGKVRRITLTDAVLSGEYAHEFLDVVENDDITGSSIAFDLNDGGDYLYYDEINANP